MENTATFLKIINTEGDNRMDLIKVNIGDLTKGDLFITSNDMGIVRSPSGRTTELLFHTYIVDEDFDLEEKTDSGIAMIKCSRVE